VLCRLSWLTLDPFLRMFWPFRHHRAGSQVPEANPHRFRHTFGADMVRAGISLPALQHLMGHAQICTTMLYVQLAPKTSGANILGPLKSGPIRTLRTSYEPRR
jgi:integrase